MASWLPVASCHNLCGDHVMMSTMSLVETEWALTIFKDVFMEVNFLIWLSIFKDVSWEPAFISIHYCNVMHWLPVGRFGCTKSMAIAPFCFWFSTELLKTMISPFWALNRNDETQLGLTLCSSAELGTTQLMKSKECKMDFSRLCEGCAEFHATSFERVAPNSGQVVPSHITNYMVITQCFWESYLGNNS